MEALVVLIAVVAVVGTATVRRLRGEPSRGNPIVSRLWLAPAPAITARNSASDVAFAAEKNGEAFLPALPGAQTDHEPTRPAALPAADAPAMCPSPSPMHPPHDWVNRFRQSLPPERLPHRYGTIRPGITEPLICGFGRTS